MKTKPFYCMDIHMVHSCQNRCTYCFIDFESGNKGQISKDVLIKNCDRIQAMVTSEKFLDNWGGVRINFWGGEPTLNPKGIEYVVKRFKDNPKIAYFLYTNGQSLNNIDHILKEYTKLKCDEGEKLTFQISYDGIASHNRTRLTSTGKKTALIVKEAIFKVYNEGYHPSIKPTLGWFDLDCISDNYFEFRRMGEILNIKNFDYSPTLDYTPGKKYTKEQMDGFISTLTEQIKKISKSEIEYYEKYGRFFFSWLNPNRSVCSAASNMGCLTKEGDNIACHGALYADSRSKDKDIFLLTKSTASDEEFIEDLLKNRKAYSEATRRPDPQCDNCFTHYCVKCNVGRSANSKKDDKFDRWVDYSTEPYMCAIYKHIGKLRLALMKIIDERYRLRTSKGVQNV